MMLVIGIDVHKATHTAVAVDQAGRKLDEKTVRATDAGHRQLLLWALRLRTTVTTEVTTEVTTAVTLKFGVEDCRTVSGRLERALLGAGQTVTRVPPHLMAGHRKAVRTPGKSDPIDAYAVALAVLREPDLPLACLDGITRELKLLSDHRETMICHRTALQNRLRWHLHELDPELHIPEGGLDRARTLTRLAGWLAEQPAGILARLAAELVADIAALTARANTIERELAALTKTLAPQLLALHGCGALTAAKLLGETANIHRFGSEARYAMHTGTAPIPASSGNTTRHRLHRGGNRQLNAALHRIAITQIRHDTPGRAYYQRRKTNGDNTMEALRALKRRLARTVYNLLKQQNLT
jgi:transposase